MYKKLQNPDSKLVVKKIFKYIQLKFDNQDVVTNNYINNNSTININKLERAINLKQDIAGLQLVRQVKQFAKTGAIFLVYNKKVKKVKLGLGYICF